MSLNVSINGQQVSITSPEGDTLRDSQSAGANNPLDSLTLAQVLNWIDGNVNDLASARTALKHLAKIIFIVRAEQRRSR